MSQAIAWLKVIVADDRSMAAAISLALIFGAMALLSIRELLEAEIAKRLDRQVSIRLVRLNTIILVILSPILLLLVYNFVLILSAIVS